MTTPRTISDYLAQLRDALHGADPALIQDALYDAEEYLRSEMAEHPALDEAAVIAQVAGSYGAPEEVAAIYRDTEVQVAQALRAPAAPERVTTLGRFFGVGADPRTYASLLFLLLALPTGIFYFVWTVTGASLSLGLAVLIIGVPFALLFLGSIRALSLVEGRLVETMLGVRMPRRPLYADRGQPFWARMRHMATDARTWSTFVYLLLRLPLGIAYFVLTVVLLSLSLGLIASPVLHLLGFPIDIRDGGELLFVMPAWLEPLVCAAGIALLFATLHLARGLGRLHGLLAKQMLVKTAQY